MPRQRFDVTSNLTDVCNALAECRATIERLEKDLETEKEYREHLSSILRQRLAGKFPAMTAEEMLRKIEADVKKSVTRVVADRKKQGRNSEDAKTAAAARTHHVISKYHLNELTKNMRDFIGQTVDEVYELKKPSFKARLPNRG
jgi:hypothetical protein